MSAPREKVIFEYSHPGRGATRSVAARAGPRPRSPTCPRALRRAQPPLLPEVGELEAVRHFTRLSQLNFSIDTHFYPLGSCTMKYNPKACNQYAMLPEFLGRHPLAPRVARPGVPRLHVRTAGDAEGGDRHAGRGALTPMAGAHGEFAGVAMIRAYHRARGDLARNEIIVPEAAHGTNPATATMCGCVVREIPVDADGDVDLRGAARRRSARTPPASCSPIPRRSACSSGASRRSRASCTRPAGCSTTTAPTSTRSSARCAPATWASTSST